MKNALTTAMSNWASAEGCDRQSALGDALTDLIHIADENDLDFNRALDRAYDVVLEEDNMA